MVVQRARENVAAFAFCAIVGGQDELVFDGHSFVVDHTGALLARAAQFEEELLVCDVDLDAAAAERLRSSGTARDRARARADASSVLATLAPPPAPAAPAPRARIAPLLEPRRGRDLRGAASRPARLRRQERLRATSFSASRAAIDSALVATIAVDALGRRARQRRGDAVAVLLGRDPGRRARARRDARRARRSSCRSRASMDAYERAARRASSRAASPTSPRRTCRRGSAATC